MAAPLRRLALMLTRSVMVVVILIVIFVDAATCNDVDQAPHKHRHNHQLPRRTRQTNARPESNMMVSFAGQFDGPNRRPTSQWLVSVNLAGNITLAEFTPDCANCSMVVEFVCGVLRDHGDNRRRCERSPAMMDHGDTKRDNWLDDLHLFRFLAADRYLCMSANKRLYTVKDRDLDATTAQDCLWYDIPLTSGVDGVVRNVHDIYHFTYPRRKKCRENERIRRRRIQTRRCPKLHLTGVLNPRTRTPTLKVVANVSASAGASIKLIGASTLQHGRSDSAGGAHQAMPGLDLLLPPPSDTTPSPGRAAVVGSPHRRPRPGTNSRRGSRHSSRRKIDAESSESSARSSGSSARRVAAAGVDAS